jgi:hypothetical protein
MNYPLDEIEGLLAKLRDERTRATDAGRDPELPFETLVIPNVMPSRDLYADLEGQGVTSTIALAWPVGDPAFAALDAKVDAMRAFADAFF